MSANNIAKNLRRLFMMNQQQISKRVTSIDIFSISILLIFIISIAFFITVFPAMTLARFFHDDSFYYIKTAYNISRGLGPTFDGINLTNGYHPLNMGLLACISFIVPLVGNNGIYMVFMLNMILLTFGLIIIDMFLKQLGFKRLARLITIVALTGAFGFNDFGLEARLLFPLAWLFIYLIFRFISTEETKLAFLLGILGALICLTRLDAVIFVALMSLYPSIYIFLSRNLNKIMFHFKQSLLIFVPSLIALIMYCLLNLIFFSRPTSVSSWLKMGWPGTFETGWFQGAVIGIKARFFLCVLISVVYIFSIVYFYRKNVFVRENLQILKRNLLFMILNLYVLIYFLVLLFFSRGAVGSWYLALLLSICVITSLFLVRVFVENLVLFKFLKESSLYQKVALVCILIVLLCGSIFFISFKSRKTARDDHIAIGLWMKKNLPKDARIYQVDGAGFTGYFSERSVINGDGVINGWEYQRYLRSNALLEYLKKYKVEYIVWTEFKGERLIKIPVPLWRNNKTVTLTFSKDPERVVRFGQYLLLKADTSSIVVE